MRGVLEFIVAKMYTSTIHIDNLCHLSPIRSTFKRDVSRSKDGLVVPKEEMIFQKHLLALI
jgi:hypothetical protein